jgi:hypothetical protein
MMDSKIQKVLEELKTLNSSTAFTALEIEKYIESLLSTIQSLKESNEY